MNKTKIQVFSEIKQSTHQKLQEQRQQQLPTNSSHEELPKSKKLLQETVNTNSV